MNWQRVRRRIADNIGDAFDDLRPHGLGGVLLMPVALAVAVVALWLAGLVALLALTFLGIDTMPSGYSSDKAELGENLWVVAHGFGLATLVALTTWVGDPLLREWEDWRRAVRRLRAERQRRYQ